MVSFDQFILNLRDSNIEQADKISLISNACKENLWFKEVLKYTYDPFIQFYIKDNYPPFVEASDSSIPFDNTLWINTIQPLLIKLNKRELDRKTYTEVIMNIESKLSKLDQELLKCIITKDLRIGFAAKRINASLNEELIPVSDCQLCKAYSPDMNIKNVNGWWASRKLNGLRGRWQFRNGEYRFLTREDYPLIGFDDISNELKYLQEKYDLKLIDGEVFNMNLPFQTIMSVARGTKTFNPEQKKLLTFNVFNIQRNNHKYKDTKEMIDYINTIFSNEKLNYIVPLEYVWCNNSAKDIVKLCEQFTDEGYEGVVLRDEKISWEGAKRNNHLLKYKIFYECDLVVKDIIFGVKGKRLENSIAALLSEGIVRARKVQVNDKDILYRPVAFMESSDDAEYVDIPVSVEVSCSSCTDEEREVLTKLGKSVIGNTVECKFQTFTDKPNDKGVYSLQFPVFSKFKNVV